MIIIILLLFIAYDTKKPNEFTASYYNLRQIGAFKFTGSDTLIQEIIYPKPKQHVYHIIDKNEKTLLNNFLLNVDFNKLEKKYTSNKQQDDLSGIYFKIKIGQTKKNIFIDANAPEEFKEVLAILKKYSQLENTPKTNYQNFGDYKFVPPVPPSTIDSSR
jgi:hypothetical protein